MSLAQSHILTLLHAAIMYVDCRSSSIVCKCCSSISMLMWALWILSKLIDSLRTKANNPRRRGSLPHFHNDRIKLVAKVKAVAMCRPEIFRCDYTLLPETKLQPTTTEWYFESLAIIASVRKVKSHSMYGCSI